MIAILQMSMSDILNELYDFDPLIFQMGDIFENEFRLLNKMVKTIRLINYINMHIVDLLPMLKTRTHAPNGQINLNYEQLHVFYLK